MLSSADLAEAAFDERPGLAGGREVVVTQLVGGHRLYGARLRLHLGRDGAFVAAVGTLYGGLRWEGEGKLSPEDACSRARAFVAKLTGAAGEASEDAGEPCVPEEVAYPLGEVAHPAWVAAAVAAPNGIDRFEVVVDATDGLILEVAPLTWYAGPQGQVFTSSSPQPSLTPGVLPPVPDPPPYAARSVVPFVGDAAMDPSGWVSGTSLSGNNATVREYQAWRGANLSTTSGHAISVTGADFQFPLLLGPGQPDIRSYPAATGTNLFYLVNVAHDYFYPLGFDEAHGNFQASNFGRGGASGDPLYAFTQLGAGAPGSTPYATSNAWMSTPADGSIPAMGMYVFGPHAGGYYTDSALDAEVVLHEFSHGVTGRLGTGFWGAQGGALNEGNSDFLALNYLTGESAPLDGAYPAGAYSEQAFATGIRTYPYSTQLAVNPLTYSSLGHVVSYGPEVHADGEIWAVTMWEIRAALIGRRGYSEGRARAAQLLVDALQLAPDFPSMIATRDALLAAERTRYAGVDQDVLWQAFAKRGMGFMAAGGDAFSVHVFGDGGAPTPAAQLRLWESDLYPGETVRLLVGDSNAAAAPVVSLTTTDGDSETVTLSQDGSVYSGAVASGGGAPVAGNGRLELAPGATLTATTADSNPGSGTPSLSDTASIRAPYAVSQTASVFDPGLATSLLGTGDDTRWSHALPFPLTFFGVEYTTVWVSSNGLLTFGGGVSGWYEGLDGPGSLPVIAPFSTDLVTNGTVQAGEGVYIHDDADRFTVRWTAQEYNGGKPASVAASLFPDGSIRFDYGSGNELWGDSGFGAHHATVGLGRGTETFSQPVSGYNGEVQLGNAGSILFKPVPPGQGEVSVTAAGQEVWDAQAAPVLFGGATTGQAAPSRTFTVRNDGYATLTLGSLTVPAGFTLTEGLVSSLPPGGSDTFTVALDTATAGTKPGDVSFATDDSDEGTFSFPVSGVVGFVGEATRCASDLPRVISDGTTVRSSLSISGPAVTLTDVNVNLTINHTYDRDLDVYLLSPQGRRVELFTDVGGSGHNFSNTTLDDEAATPITAGAAPFSGTFRPEGSLAVLDGGGLNGAWVLEVSDYTAGDTGTLASWCLVATVASPAALAEVAVLVGSTGITDGQATAVDFGAPVQGSTGPSRVFTVRNEGYTTLSLGAVTVPAGFSVTEGLAASLAAGASDTFTVQMGTATIGTSSGEISFATNDSDENPFNFPVTGTVVACTPPSITTHPASQTVGLGQAATLSVTAAGAAPLTYQWYRGTAPDTANPVGTNSASFTTPPLTETTSYWVRVSNACGAADSNTATITVSGGGQSLIFSDDFEGPFPGSWQLYPPTPTTGWGKTSYRASGGTSSVWCAGGGSSPQPPGGNYLANMDTWIVYGPFSLADASDASLEFDLWMKTESSFDFVYYMVSLNGNDFHGYRASGDNGGWVRRVFNFRDVTSINVIGQPQVWVAFAFSSDSSIQYEGVYIDNVLLRKSVTGAPEITVLEGTTAITDGQTTPVSFGEVAQGGPAPSKTFTVRNEGGAALTLGAVSVPAGFTLAESLSSSLAPGASDTFTVRMETTTPGPKSGDVSFATNDADENPFNFAITGTVTATSGETCSSDVPKAIPDVQTVTSNLAIGGASEPISDVDVRVNITHTFDADLDVFLIAPGGTRVELFTDVGKMGDNFVDTVLDDEAATAITAGAPPFTGSFRPEGSLAALDGQSPNGTWTLEVTDDEGLDVGTLNGWCLTITTAPAATSRKLDFGTATSPVASGYTRVAHTTTYSAAQGFGWVSGVISSRERATGNDLTRDFNLTTDGTFAADVSNGAWDVKVIMGDASASHDQEGLYLEGTQADTISTAVNQFATRTYRVTVADGQLTLRLRDLGGADPYAVINALELTPPPAGPEVAAFDGATSIIDGQTAAISFGSVAAGGTPPAKTFTVRNEGTAALTLGAVSVPAGFTLTEGLSTTLAGGAMDTFTVRLDTATAGVKGGEISFATDDADENPFSFAVAGTVTGVPEITVLDGAVNIADGQAAAISFGSATLGAPGPSKTFTVRNDGSAPLTLGAVTAPAGFTVTEGLAPSLAPGASDTFTVRLDTVAAGTKTGQISFSNNDGNENPFNFPIAGTVIGVPARRFDFGTATSPVASSYLRVAHTSTYSASLGYGWLSGTVDSRDRGTGSDLTRDFNFTQAATFAVDVPNGSYDVTVTMGDATLARDQMGVFLEGSQVDSISTLANVFAVRTYRVAVGDGQLTVLLDDLGGADINVVINALEVAGPRSFDFGTPTSPVAAGFTRVAHTSVYGVSQGYGWLSGTVDSRDRTSGSDLARDFNFTTLGTFAVDVFDGTYDVRLTIGDAVASHEQMGVFLEGTQVDTVTTAVGQIVTRTYRVTVADGQLTLLLDDLGGPDPFVVINGLEITRVASP